ncbi:hypothetical protein Mucpa_1705 [Mucilaginibacter paludis DSM 18603]|uniref:Uncharacterized protein n=1 Tax=Mucilaginibacter paludis DSM 18603 TaxID=714943 RepID=H1Y6L6_9SPHI|nr:hypothetical protein Mucpa_1705 [Mucilaginibacter paludis DSM 18603]
MRFDLAVRKVKSGYSQFDYKCPQFGYVKVIPVIDIC